MENKKNNKNTFLVIGGLLLVILVIVGFFVYGKKTDASRFKKEYESLNGTIRESDKQTIRTIEINKDNPFVYQTADEIVDRMDKNETFVVYFGFADCPWCRSVLPTLIDVSTEMNIETIYYVDVKEIRDVMEMNNDGEFVTTTKGTDGYYKLIDKMGEVLNDYTVKDKNGNSVPTGTKRIYAPNLVIISHGDAIALETGISSEQDNAYMELTDEMKQETYNKFKDALQKLNGDGGVCSNETGC